jgi:hypothetical protein
MVIKKFLNKYKIKFLFIIFIALILILLSVIYFHISSYLLANSDNAAPILEANSFINGNIKLYQWHLSSDNFYSIDLIFYILIELITGVKEYLTALVPVIIYILTLISVIYISAINLDKKYKISAILITLGLIGTAPLFLLDQTLSGPDHVGTILFILISFILIFQIIKKGNYYYYLIPFSLLSFMYLFGDPISRWIGSIPIIIFSIIFYFYEKKDNKNPYFLIGVCTILVLVVSLILRNDTAKFGFFYLITIGSSFVTLSQLHTHIYYLIFSILKLQGAYFFGKNIFAKTTIIELIRLLVLLITVSSIYIIIKNIIKKSIDINKIDKLNLLLILALILNILSFVFGGIFVNSFTSRYLIAVPIFGSILIARYLSPYIVKNKVYIAITGIIISLFIVFFIHETILIKPSSNQEKILSNFLEQHNLKYGYATYWDAGITTIYTDNSIKVRQVISVNNRIYPYLWLSNSQWYSKTANFVVYGNHKTKAINLQIAINSFGKPSKIYKVDGFTILIWNYNITSKL